MPIARQSFAAPGGRVVVAGQEIGPDDVILVGREHLFDGVPRVLERTPATTEATEKPRKRAARKPAAKSDD